MSLERTAVVAPDAPAGRGPYPQGLRAGPFVFVSGQGPLSPQTNAPVATGFDEQVRLTIDNVEAVLRAAGLGLEHVVKVTVYLADLSRVEPFNKIYASRFPEPRPARTLVAAGLRGIDVELDVIAMRPDSWSAEGAP